MLWKQVVGRLQFLQPYLARGPASSLMNSMNRRRNICPSAPICLRVVRGLVSEFLVRDHLPQDLKLDNHPGNEGEGCPPSS